ncbi:MAG: GNAT family N-acetyltransferase [Hyphomicrobiaceae bacterium]
MKSDFRKIELPRSNLLNCEIISDIDGFRRLRPEWSALLEKSTAASFFLTYEYLWTWWNVYGARYNLRILAARSADGRLVGLAPLMIGAGDNSKRRLLRNLAFIGGLGDTLSEYQDFIVAPGHETSVVARFVQALFDRLGAEWDLMQLGMVHAESPCLSPLRAAIAAAGGGLRFKGRHIAPYVGLPSSWDAYLASRSKSFRTGFKGRVGKLRRNHCVEFLTAGVEVDPVRALSIITSLNQERWGAQSRAFHSNKYREFHLRLAESLMPREQSYIVVMTVDGEAVAAGYDLIYRQKVYGFQGGWKRSMARAAIGKIMLGKQIEWAIERGLTEYDFLCGDTAYKADWATGQRELLDLEAMNPRSFRGIMFEKVRSLRNSLMEPVANIAVLRGGRGR